MASADKTAPVYPDPEVAARYSGRVLYVDEICELLPHRPPFLLLDRIVELEPGVRGVALKAVTIGEPHFAGHFPGHPVMPGVLIIEALAQLTGVVIISGMARRDYRTYFTGIEAAKFRQIVQPGDLLELTVAVERARMFGSKMLTRARMEARVSGEMVTEANGTFALVDPSAG